MSAAAALSTPDAPPNLPRQFLCLGGLRIMPLKAAQIIQFGAKRRVVGKGSECHAY